VEPDYLLDLEVFVFSPCLYPMKNLHLRRMYTPPRGGVQRGVTPLWSLGASDPLGGWVWGQSPRRKNCLVNVYCNFIVNMDLFIIRSQI
jgi:hypothetical protein